MSLKALILRITLCIAGLFLFITVTGLLGLQSDVFFLAPLTAAMILIGSYVNRYKKSKTRNAA